MEIEVEKNGSSRPPDVHVLNSTHVVVALTVKQLQTAEIRFGRHIPFRREVQIRTATAREKRD